MSQIDCALKTLAIEMDFATTNGGTDQMGPGLVFTTTRSGWPFKSSRFEVTLVRKCFESLVCQMGVFRRGEGVCVYSC